MSQPADRISRRTAVQRLAATSLGVAALAQPLSAAFAANLGLPSRAQRADRLAMVFLRDPSLTGADELTFFHGSTTRLEPSLGSWLVHARGPIDARATALQCLEWGPSTSAQRMSYAGELPAVCRGEVKSARHSHTARNARVVQAIHPASAPFSVAGFSCEQDAHADKRLLVLAGTHAQIEACAKELQDRKAHCARFQVENSRMHVLLHGRVIQTHAQQVRSADLHATLLAACGVSIQHLAHRSGSREFRPIAAQGRVIPGVFA
jgi:hypothetical protein